MQEVRKAQKSAFLSNFFLGGGKVDWVGGAALWQFLVVLLYLREDM